MSQQESPTDIRQNPKPLPASLGRRDLPGISLERLRARSVTFDEITREIVRPGPQQPRIVSSAHGAIRHLLLCYPTYADDEYSFQSVYADLFRKLPKTTRLTILSHPEVTADLQQALGDTGASDRATIVEAPEYLNFLVWAEDPYVVVEDVAQDPPVTYLVEPYTFPRAGDAAISDYIAGASHIRSVQSPLYFQGGNILIGDDFVLIGADYPANTQAMIESRSPILVPDGVDVPTFVKDLYRKTFDPDRELHYVGTRLPVPEPQARRVRIGREWWQEHIYLGTGTAQPIFHIDMFLSLAGRGEDGRYRVLVGSPYLADRLLGRRFVPHAMSEIFDDVAANLTRLGFDVRRNPLPITYVDDQASKVRSWYFATSNNCLVQIDAARGDAVWLPTYGHGDWADLTVTDAENRRIWEELGFEVHQLADFNPFAQGLGSVHCIKKYLAR